MAAAFVGVAVPGVPACFSLRPPAAAPAEPLPLPAAVSALTCKICTPPGSQIVMERKGAWGKENYLAFCLQRLHWQNLHLFCSFCTVEHPCNISYKPSKSKKE